MSEPKPISDLELAFPTSVSHLMPPYENIPEEFQLRRSKWNRVFSDWFYSGLRNAEWQPKDGIDQREALRHIKAIMGSWEPKHEHKEAGVAYLLSLWFEDVKYEKAKP